MIYRRVRTVKNIAVIAICLLMTVFSSCGSGEQSASPSELIGEWEIGGIYYNGRLIDVNDVPDLGFNDYLTINDDESFIYRKSVFGNKGTVKTIEGEGGDNYLLDSDESFIYEFENGEIVEKPTTDKNEPAKYLAVLLDENTLEIYKYDAAMGKTVAGEDPVVFVMTGKDSEYIASNKFALNTGKNSNTPKASTGSSQSETPKADTSNSQSEAPKVNSATPSGSSSYQSILDDYTSKMENAVPGLVQEYYSEASGASDITEKAEICNAKVGKLAEICNEGVSRMAELMNKNGDSYDTYEKWAGKLMDNYTEIAQEIQDAYMDSAM